MAQLKNFSGIWVPGVAKSLKDSARCVDLYLKLPLLFSMSSELWVQFWLFWTDCCAVFEGADPHHLWGSLAGHGTLS